jgi:hypothetical protein
MAETRKIAGILAADVVGYSRLAGADEERPPTIPSNSSYQWNRVSKKM